MNNHEEPVGEHVDEKLEGEDGRERRIQALHRRKIVVFILEITERRVIILDCIVATAQPFEVPSLPAAVPSK